jgi:hypothetical protein
LSMEVRLPILMSMLSRPATGDSPTI